MVGVMMSDDYFCKLGIVYIYFFKFLHNRAGAVHKNKLVLINVDEERGIIPILGGDRGGCS